MTNRSTPSRNKVRTVVVRPMDLRVGDVITNTGGIWEVSGPAPRLCRRGEAVEAVVQRLARPGSAQIMEWPASENLMNSSDSQHNASLAQVTLLNRAKLALLGLGQRAGLLRLARDSKWRDRRLLVLCYHGVALEDEYQWNPSLYVSPATFDRRLELMRRSGCTVLPFDDAIAALYAGALPERSVTITFDDGHHDFYRVAHPRLSAAGFPALVYLTTYHCDHNQPIYGLMCSYLLWKSRGRRLDLSRLVPDRPAVELESPATRRAVLAELVAFAERNALSADDKHAVARRLASELRLDFEALCARRFLHLLNPAEVTELAGRGVAFELHTHSHRSPSEELPYREQVRRNRERVIEMTARRPAHFSYPSNVYGAQFIPWLEAEGVKTATTCVPGLASPASHPLLLPRLLDAETITDVEFEAWLAGAAAFGPRSARARLGLRKLARASRARPLQPSALA